MIPVKASSFGRLTGAVRRYPGGTENAIILLTLSREMLKDERADLLTADSLGYLSLEGLREASRVDGHPVRFCEACFSGEYPVGHGKLEDA